MESPTDVIPHRPPFLFVDRIVELRDDGLTAELVVDPAAGFFAGHYPGNPVMPGVLLCEALIQAGAVYIGRRDDLGADDRVPVLTRIGTAKFRRMVRPGETLTLEVRETGRAGPAVELSGKAMVAGKTAVTLTCTVAIVDAGQAQANGPA
jgi:3-hydroxyacyl-[acyl-carrier-protein] dehydratase